MTVFATNSAYLKSTMDDFIADVYSTEDSKRKTRSGVIDAGETYATQSMMCKMFGKLSEEFAQLLQNMDDEHKSKEKDMMKLHLADKERWQKERDDLINQIDNISQYSRRDNIKIIGVKETDDEKLDDIVVDIIKHTGVELTVDDISIAHRINTKDDASETSGTTNRTKKIPSILCKLKSRSKRGEIFKARRNIKDNRDAPHPSAQIFDDITPLRSRLMFALKNRKEIDSEDKLYAHVWSREGRIYCRTAQDVLPENRVRHAVSGQLVMPKPKIINKPQDLLNLGWSPDEIQDIINNVRQ